jgi:hypothetical protein
VKPPPDHYFCCQFRGHFSNGYPHIFDHSRLPALHDIDQHPELMMSDTKPEEEITIEHKEMATQFQRLPLIFFGLD